MDPKSLDGMSLGALEGFWKYTENKSHDQERARKPASLIGETDLSPTSVEKLSGDPDSEEHSNQRAPSLLRGGWRIL